MRDRQNYSDEVLQDLQTFEKLTDLRKRNFSGDTDSNENVREFMQRFKYQADILNPTDYKIKFTNAYPREGKVHAGLTCYELHEILKRPCRPQDNPCPLIKAAIEKKKVVVRHDYSDENGNNIQLEIHAVPVYDKDGNFVELVKYAFKVAEPEKERVTYRYSVDENGVINPEAKRSCFNDSAQAVNNRTDAGTYKAYLNIDTAESNITFPHRVFFNFPSSLNTDAILKIMVHGGYLTLLGYLVYRLLI